MRFRSGIIRELKRLAHVVFIGLVLFVFLLSRNSYGNEGVNAQELLDTFEWSHRPILIFGSGEAGGQANAQLHSLSLMDDDLASRDIVLLSVQRDKVVVQRPRQGSSEGKAEAHGDAALADGLRGHFEVERGSFALLLIGKDGSVKRRSDAVVDVETLFKQIDSMPMRQSERARD